MSRSRFFGNETRDEQLARTSVSRLSREAARKFPFRKFCSFVDERLALNAQSFQELIDQFNAKVVQPNGQPAVDVPESSEMPKDPEDSNSNWGGDSEAGGEEAEDVRYSPFPLIRLMIPSYDRRKSTLTPRILRKSLESFIKADFTVDRVCAEEYAKFVSRHHHGTSKHLSVDAVNKFLDVIAFDRPHRNNTIQKLCSSMNESELRWLFRIFFGEISDAIVGRPGGAGIIMGFLSPNARQLHDAGMDLLSICCGAYEAHRDNRPLTATLILNRPIRPMLLAKITCDEEGILKVIKNCGRPFYLETKFDGEHFLVHRVSHDLYSYFTRKQHDYTEHFGADSNTRFSARLHRFFRDDVEDCVLDCEIVIWDRENKRVLGKNRETETGRVMDVKHLEENDPRFQRACIVLDVLLLNEEPLFERPLHERLEILRTRIFKERLDPSTVQISQQIECERIQDFRNFYSEQLKKGEEGIVIKGKNTTYHFGQRFAKNGWFKVKPDYGARLTLDLAVVGVRYENGDKQKFRSLLLAAMNDDGKLRMVGGVQPSLKKTDLERLLKEIDIQSQSHTECPDWLVGFSKREKVTNYVVWDRLRVVEVKASGVINGKLQFPAVTSLRLDKFIEEIDAYAEVMAYEGKLRERKALLPGNFFVLHGHKRRRVVMNADAPLGPAAKRKAIPRTQLNGVEVVVIDDTPNRKLLATRRDQMRELGATLVENYVKSAKFAVSLNPKGVGTKALTKKDVVHIVSHTWLQRCANAKKLLPWEPNELMHNCSDAPFDLFTVDEEDANVELFNQTTEEADRTITVPMYPEVVRDKAEEAKEEEQLLIPETREEREAAIDQATDAEISSAVDGQAGGDVEQPERDVHPHEEEENEEDGRSEATDGAVDDAAALFDAQSLEDELPAADEDRIFDGLQFHPLGHTRATMDRDYRAKIERAGGTIVNELSDDITHLFFQEKYDFNKDPHGLMPWLNRFDWSWMFTDRHWIDRALEEKDRYRDSVLPPDVTL